MTELRVILLAGDRRPDDPLLAQTGVCGKALIPIGGRALLTRVLSTLSQLTDVAEICLLAPERDDYRLAVAAAQCRHPISWLTPDSTPARSVAKALHHLATHAGDVLLTTADHPLLSPAMIAQLRSDAPACDLVVALADADEVARRFPGGRRTRYRLRGGSYCGTNLFLIRSHHGRQIAQIWQRVEQHRKSPWRIAAQLGPLNLLAFQFGWLSLDGALRRLSRRLGMHVTPVVLSGLPESAVDVDTPADLALVQQVLLERESTR